MAVPEALEPEQLLDVKRVGGEWLGLVKWKNFPVSRSSYVPLPDLPESIQRCERVFFHWLSISRLLFVTLKCIFKIY